MATITTDVLEERITQMSTNNAQSINNVNLKLASTETSISVLNSSISTLQSNNQSIQDEVNELSGEIEDTNTRVDTLESTLNQKTASYDSKFSSTSSQISSLQAEDLDLHSEIHTVSLAVDDAESRIEALETSNYQDQIDTLTATSESLDDKIDAMDEEHHEELHSIALSIDNIDSRLDSIELTQSNTPGMVAISESDYAALGTPDTNTIYFIYEED